MTRHLTLLLALAVASGLAGAARAAETLSPPDERVVVLAQPATEEVLHGEPAPEGLVAVLAEEARMLTDVPDGLVAVWAELPDAGFSDGGDLPEGFIRVQAPPAGFSDGGDLPEPIPVIMEVLGNGFSDGGDLPEGYVAVMVEPVSLRPPPGG
jgi:hypothetical protein